ncbi:MAG: flagellar basal body-associated FliL family protein [Bdellovibrionales bacterium]|nr:flagellar basal body-associated FliL family protein [Bdellovibrionales bacterium]
MKKIGLILGLVNTVAIAAVLGLFVYTKLIFKRPPITEEKERVRIEKTESSVPTRDRSQRVLMSLDPITVNLDAYQGGDGKPKTHYASVSLSLELRSEGDRKKVEEAKPAILDHVIQNLSKRKFQDLNQVQGRYVFKSQVIDDTNAYLKAPIVTEVYLLDLLLQ